MDAHISLFPTAARHGEADWLALLWICEAHFAYRRLYSLEHGSPRMVDFLVADPSLAHSIRYGLAQVVEALDAVAAPRPAASDRSGASRGPDGSQRLDAVAAGPPLQIEAERRAGRMAASVDHDWPDRDPHDDKATRAVLQDIGESCRLLNDDIAAAYFDYEIEDAP